MTHPRTILLTDIEGNEFSVKGLICNGSDMLLHDQMKIVFEAIQLLHPKMLFANWSLMIIENAICIYRAEIHSTLRDDGSDEFEYHLQPVKFPYT